MLRGLTDMLTTVTIRKKWCITTAQKFQEPETEVLQSKLQKFYAHSFVKLMWA